MWTSLLMAVGLVFVFEGILPLAFPNWYRKFVVRLSHLPSHKLRSMGLFSMLVGLIIVIIVHHVA